MGAHKIFACLTVLSIFITIGSSQNLNLLKNCQRNSTLFDQCIKKTLNQMRLYFKTGIPEYSVKPFDPHYAKFVQQRRGDPNGIFGYNLILSDVYEFGWTDSEITSFRSDPKNDFIVYSQFFPNKSLVGNYEFKGKIIGNNINNKGKWELVLGDYSQTTKVQRTNGEGSMLKVNVEVDKIGKMSLHISNLWNGRRQLENVMDNLINLTWEVGLPFVKPLINDLVSTAFTDIFNESFRSFPIKNFIN